MKVCCLGDIYYSGSGGWLTSLAKGVIREYCGECDVAVIVGDISVSGELGHVKEVLTIIGEAVNPISILVVPGNHDIYVTQEETNKGINSLHKLELFNSLVEKLGYVALMKNPFILGGVGLVGSIGWYDYSFAPDHLGLSLEDFRTKAFGLSIWADRDYVKLSMSDEEFTLMLLNKLEDDIKKVYSVVDKIVVVMHHVPFREMAAYKLRPEWDYFSAFMGFENFGYIIRKCKDRVKLVVHGHSHDGVATKVCKEINGVKVCNCASPIPLVVEV